jgi:unsaturated chondroitin disaccharide hydrolase
MRSTARYIICSVAIALCLHAVAQQNVNINKKTLALVNKQLFYAVKQYQYFCTQVNDTLFPKTIGKDGRLENSKSWWWCSGFFPGTLLYLTEFKKDDTLQKEAQHRLQLLEREQYNTNTHDLGFMMYCSYGNALRQSYNEKYKDILVQSARSLSTRYSPVTGCIRSWNEKRKNDFIVIIDNMMNLEMLFYATKVTGDSSYYKIAVSHADKTLQNHFRKDYSSYHVVDYNATTGAVDIKRTQQGAHDTSAWARGQGWALYGYTTMYRETKDKKYLDQANNIAKFILHHPNLPKDKIPYWDFNAPGIPHAFRDASAGALITSALIELSTYNKGTVAKEYLETASTIIQHLSNKTYTAAIGENYGFLLKHSVGSLPQNSEIDVPLTYADYYYVEALLRYKALAAGKNFLYEPNK